MPGVNGIIDALHQILSLLTSRLVATRFAVLLSIASSVFGPCALIAQTTDANAPKRVTVSRNADNSQTAYEFDPANRKATATTTSADGKAMGKILYLLDDAGRFASGEVLGPKGEFGYRTKYKYDAAGRLQEEIRLTKGDVIQMRLVYSYDQSGKQTGYTVYDAAGKVLGQTKPVTPGSPATEKGPR